MASLGHNELNNGFLQNRFQSLSTPTMIYHHLDSIQQYFLWNFLSKQRFPFMKIFPTSIIWYFCSHHNLNMSPTITNYIAPLWLSQFSVKVNWWKSMFRNHQHLTMRSKTLPDFRLNHQNNHKFNSNLIPCKDVPSVTNLWNVIIRKEDHLVYFDNNLNINFFLLKWPLFFMN